MKGSLTENSLRAFCQRMGFDRILREFAVEDNLPLTPDTISYGSKQKVWWQCERGHKWQSTVTVRTSGGGCPYCAGKLPLVGQTDLATTHPQLAAQWHPTKNGSLTPQQFTAGSNRKVWWQCQQGHQWEARISSRKGGIDCPVCSGRMVVAGVNDLATCFPALSAQWAEENEGKPSQIRPYSNRKVWWRCALGHRWQTTVNARCTNDSGCPYCMNRRLLTGFNDLATREPDIAAQWHPILNGDRTPETVLFGANKYAWWICPQGHVWRAMIYSRTAKRKRTGCPICAGNISRKARERYERIAAAVRQPEGE